MNALRAADLAEHDKGLEYAGGITISTIIRPRRVGEADLGHALADWFAGAPWALEDAEWSAHGRRAVHLRDLGNALACDGVVIATRNPRAVIAPLPGANRAHLSEARAVARVAMRDDHLKLYGARA